MRWGKVQCLHTMSLKERFCDTSINLMKSIDCLRPKSQNFLASTVNEFLTFITKQQKVAQQAAKNTKS